MIRFFIFDFLIDIEQLFGLPTGKQVIDRLHHGGAGAKVGGEAVGAAGQLPGIQVGVDVRPAKLKDGLLGVTNHQQAVQATLLEYCLKDAVLDFVRVLEFVHHDHRPPSCQAAGQA